MRETVFTCNIEENGATTLKMTGYKVYTVCVYVLHQQQFQSRSDLYNKELRYKTITEQISK